MTVIDKLQAAVRPVVTLLFATAIVVGFLVGKVGADVFAGMAGMVLSFWFAQRQADKLLGTENGNGKVETTVKTVSTNGPSTQ